MIGLESDKNYIFLSFWETCAGHPVASMPHAGRGRRLSFQRGGMPRARFYRLGLRETMLGLQDERPLSKIEKKMVWQVDCCVPDWQIIQCRVKTTGGG